MPNPSGYAVGWGTLALINAGLAQGKRRSGLLWFVLSLGFGPLATLFLVLLPASGDPQRPMRRAEWLSVGIALVVFVIVAALSFLGVAIGRGVAPQSGTY